jgi:hypothetical protein
MRAPQARRRLFFSCPDGVTGATLLRDLRRGDRRALARAITLVESSRPDHRDQAERIIEALLPERDSSSGIALGPQIGERFEKEFQAIRIDRCSNERRYGSCLVCG